MQIYYIRHGQSANNQLYAESGSEKGRVEDPPLTEVGWRQAWFLAEHVARMNRNTGGRKADLNFIVPGEGSLYEYQFTHIYTSLMTRAVQTASVLSKKIGIPLFGMAELHEAGGVYLEDENTGEKVGKPGKTPAELRREFPELILPDGLAEDGWYNRPYEERENRLPRAKRVLNDLLVRHSGSPDRVALVSHGAFYQYFITAVLGLDERPPVWFFLNNAAITRIDAGERFDIIYMNRTHHIPEDILT